MLVVTWLLASLVFMTSYSGILTAMLTIPRVTIKIDSLADLVAQSDLPWRLEGGAMMFNYFNVSRKRCLIILVPLRPSGAQSRVLYRLLCLVVGLTRLYCGKADSLILLYSHYIYSLPSNESEGMSNDTALVRLVFGAALWGGVVL